MTSKNLYFKLMREDWKNRLWAPALIALASFFAYPVLLAFLAGKAHRDWNTAAEALKWFSGEAVNWISFENGVAVFFVVAVSLVCGLSSFYYLTSGKRVDFYHSIPVRRETLFLVHYVDGILMPAIPYALALLVSIVVCAANGMSTDILCSTALSAYTLHMIYYILCYTTVVIASMMTGHLVIGFFGSMVLMFYMPIAAGLINSFFGSFFLSYCYPDKASVLEKFTRISPVMEYIHTVSLYGDHADRTQVVMAAVTAVIVSVLLMVTAVCLYKKRPSEAAGKAMAFSASQPIIRILITVVAGLGMGDFFWSLQQSNGWLVFGAVCGSMISHCVIESIYHFDFRKLFSHKGQLAFSTIAALVILLSFRFDLFGYDAYLPSASRVAYASVDISGLNNWVSYGKVVEDQEMYGRRVRYGYETISSESYMAQHMQSTDVETILNFAAAGIEENRILKSEWGRSGTMAAEVIHGAEDDMAEALIKTAENSETMRYTTATVTYTLKSGRKVSRNYTINMTKSYELIKKICQDGEYQKAAYPLLAADAGSIVNVRYRQNRSKGDQSLKNLTQEERTELLSAYRQEFSGMNLDQMKEELPVGLIRFTTELDEKAIAWWNNPDKTEYDGESVWNYYYGPDVRDEEFYPVYPSFTKTIALLEQYGASVKNEELMDRIISVKVSGYAPNSDAYQEIMFTDPEEIKALGDMTRDERMLYYDPMYEEENLTVEVTVADKTEKAEGEESLENTYSSFFKKGEIPQIVKERMGC